MQEKRGSNETSELSKNGHIKALWLWIKSTQHVCFGFVHT